MYLDLLYNKSGFTVRFITMFNYVVLSPLTLFCDGLERLEQFTSRCLSYIAVLWSVLMIILPINYTITLNKRFASHLVDIFLFCFLFCYIFVVSLFYIICVILCCLSSIHPKKKVILTRHSITKLVICSMHVHISSTKLFNDITIDMCTASFL